MAGNYMDAPSDRVAWDRDGSIMTLVSMSGTVTALSAAQRRTVNSEDEDTVEFGGNIRYAALVFPVPLDVVAVFLALSMSSAITIETSKDTTNGLDGSWGTQYLTGLNRSRNVKPGYRRAANLDLFQTNSASSDLRGIRFGRTDGLAMSDGIRAWHVYGTPATTATTDRLALWHPTLDVKVPAAWFDWGNTPRSSSDDREFRIKNLSTVLTATDIDVYVEAITGGTPSVATMHSLSDNGGATFQSSLTLPALLPGEISDVLTVRRVVPSNALVSVWSARIAADVNLWQE